MAGAEISWLLAGEQGRSRAGRRDSKVLLEKLNPTIPTKPEGPLTGEGGKVREGSPKVRYKRNGAGEGGARAREKETRQVTESEMEPADGLSPDGRSRARSREMQKPRGARRALTGGWRMEAAGQGPSKEKQASRGGGQREVATREGPRVGGQPRAMGGSLRLAPVGPSVPQGRTTAGGSRHCQNFPWGPQSQRLAVFPSLRRHLLSQVPA